MRGNRQGSPSYKDVSHYPLQKKDRLTAVFFLERIMGIEPTSTAWEAVVLPMNYIRVAYYYITPLKKFQEEYLELDYIFSCIAKRRDALCGE